MEGSAVPAAQIAGHPSEQPGGAAQVGGRGRGRPDGRAANREPSSGRTERPVRADGGGRPDHLGALEIASNRWPGIAIARSAASEGDYLRLPEERTVILRAKVPI